MNLKEAIKIHNELYNKEETEKLKDLKAVYSGAIQSG